MPKPGITYAEVVTAIEALMSSGDKPTIQKIRTQLGERGSPVTISKHVKAWKEAVATLKADTTPTPAPVTTSTNPSPVSEKVKPETPEVKIATQVETKKTLKVRQAPVQKAPTNNSDIIEAAPEAFTNLPSEKLKIKILQLESMITKEQSRRESAENMARDMRDYADTVKTDIAKRITVIETEFQATIDGLRADAVELKKQASTDLRTYHAALEKANAQLSAPTS